MASKPQQQTAKNTSSARTNPPASTSKEVTTPRATAVAKHEDVPDYIKTGNARGAENVGTEDLIIPRLEIAQMLSPCIDKQHAGYIEGCQAGDFYNSVTRELYGPKVAVVPVFFKKEYLVWKDRKKGGGFRGAHATHDMAQARLDEQETPDDYAINETNQQFVLVLREDGTTEQAVVSMSRTKLKVSRNWNSLMRIAGGDTFSRYYYLISVDETNANNDRYKNMSILPGKWAPQVAYEEAESIYTGISKGTIKVKVDDNFEDTGGAGTGSDKGEY